MEVLPEMVDELADICTSLEWEYHRIDDLIELAPDSNIPEQRSSDGTSVALKGIIINPPQGESIMLTFVPSGYSMNFITLRAGKQYEGLPDLIYWQHTKTQYAPIETHISIVQLLRYLESKYFSELEVSDEGEYWDTNDEELLKSHFEVYRALITTVASALENDTPLPGMNGLGFRTKLETILKFRMKNRDN